MSAALPAIAFHFNVPDKAHYACRLLRKALARGSHRTALVADAAELPKVDRLLWTFSALDFVPHCCWGSASETLRQASPVVLLTPAEMALAGHLQAWPLLINTAASWPEGWQAFGRVIEIVSQQPEDRQNARQRWRDYQAQGCEISQFDWAKQSASG